MYHFTVLCSESRYCSCSPFLWTLLYIIWPKWKLQPDKGTPMNTYICTCIYNCQLEITHYFGWCTWCYMESFDSIFNHFQNFFVELSLLSWQECVHQSPLQIPVCFRRPIIVKIWVNIFGAVLNVPFTNHMELWHRILIFFCMVKTITLGSASSFCSSFLRNNWGADWNHGERIIHRAMFSCICQVFPWDTIVLWE